MQTVELKMLGIFHICFCRQTMELSVKIFKEDHAIGLIGIDRIIKKVVFKKTCPNLPYNFGHVIFEDSSNFYFIANENVNHWITIVFLFSI